MKGIDKLDNDKRVGGGSRNNVSHLNIRYRS